ITLSMPMHKRACSWAKGFFGSSAGRITSFMALRTDWIWMSGRNCMSGSLFNQFAHVVHQHVADADQPGDQHVLVGLAVAGDSEARGQGQDADEEGVIDLVPMESLAVDAAAAGTFVGREELFLGHQAVNQEGPVGVAATEGRARGVGQVLVRIADAAQFPVQPRRYAVVLLVE